MFQFMVKAPADRNSIIIMTRKMITMLPNLLAVGYSAICSMIGVSNYFKF